jgi:hypothetical protein
MLKRMESFILSRANLWNSFSQNHIPEVSFKLLYNVSRDNLNYDQASYILVYISFSYTESNRQSSHWFCLFDIA